MLSMKTINYLKMPMGAYQTNCYIVKLQHGDLIIDPGVDAFEWVKQNSSNPIAILNTHGHFDHVWSNNQIKEYFKIPIYIPKDDAFMLSDDPFDQGTPPSKADILVEPNQSFIFDNKNVTFIHYPGHTPGCSVIEIEDDMFSGDFIFKGSIGRVDFPYSNVESMKDSINRVLSIENDKFIHPGHGGDTTLFNEKGSLKRLSYII